MLANSYGSLTILVLAGLLAGAINSVAGGGSLISFPLLIALGVPSIPANATNAVALWPGSLASVWGYRAELRSIGKITTLLTLPTILGSLFGAWILLHTPEQLFNRVVPFLILLATILLWQQPRFKKYAAGHTTSREKYLLAMILQLVVSIYGGYFGAGMGIMMLASLSFTISGTIHRLNAIKTWLATLINIVASGLFITSDKVLLLPALALAFGSIIGGYVGARLALRLNPDLMRKIIVGIGFILTIVFWLKL